MYIEFIRVRVEVRGFELRGFGFRDCWDGVLFPLPGCLGISALRVLWMTGFLDVGLVNLCFTG